MTSIPILILDAVAPVFLVVAVGVGLRRWDVLDGSSTARLNRFVFVAAAPAFLFRSAAQVGSAPSSMWAVAAVAASSVVIVLVAYLLWHRSSAPRRSVSAQGAFRSNLVFLGLPIAGLALGEPVLGALAVPIGLCVVVYNVVGTITLVLPHTPARSLLSLDTALRLAKDSATNPLVIGSLSGLAWARLGLSLPTALDQFVQLLGQSAMPLALVALGASLQFGAIRAELLPSLGVSFVKLVVYPALVWLLLAQLDVDPLIRSGMVVCAATPTAVASHVMAVEMKGDPHLSSAVVMVSTLLSVLTVPAWLLVLMTS